MLIISTYLFIINATAFLFMLIDKRRSIQKRWRIPEATLLFVAFLGGSYGTLLAMRIFRHKTKKPLFYIGLPLLASVQTILLLPLSCILI